MAPRHIPFIPFGSGEFSAANPHLAICLYKWEAGVYSGGLSSLLTVSQEDIGKYVTLAQSEGFRKWFHYFYPWKGYLEMTDSKMEELVRQWVP